MRLTDIEDDPGFDRNLVAITAAGGLPRQPIARVFKIGSNALFSYRKPGLGTRDKPGIMEELLDGDEDPARLQIDNNQYRILAIVDESGRYDGIPTFGLFVKAYGQLSCSDCERIAHQFGDLAGHPNLEVRLRPEAWFDGPYFPVVFRFEPDNSPGTLWNPQNRLVITPTVRHFYRTVPEVMCSLGNQPGSCLKWNVSPN